VGPTLPCEVCGEDTPAADDVAAVTCGLCAMDGAIEEAGRILRIFHRSGGKTWTHEPGEECNTCPKGIAEVAANVAAKVAAEAAPRWTEDRAGYMRAYRAKQKAKAEVEPRDPNCRNGHPYRVFGTTRPDGSRHCKRCKADRQRGFRSSVAARGPKSRHGFA